MKNDDKPTNSPNTVPKPPVQNLICTKGFYLSPYIKKSNSNSAIKEILRKKFNKNQTNLIFIKIIKRVCKELF